MQDIIEKKADLDYIYDMAQQAAEAGDIDQAIKLSEKGLKEAETQADTEWAPKFEMLASNIKATHNLHEPKVAVIVRDKKDLTKIKGVGYTHAVNLQEAGYITVEQIANTSPKILANVKGIGLATAKKFVQAAQEYLGNTFDFQEKSKERESEEPQLYQRLLSKYTATETEGTTRESKPWFNENYHIDRTSQSIPPKNEVKPVVLSNEIDIEEDIDESETENEIQEIVEEAPVSISSQERPSIQTEPKKEDDVIQKIRKKVTGEGFHIIPRTVKKLDTLLSGMDFTAIKIIESSNKENILLICPIKINSVHDSIIVSERRVKYSTLSENNLQLDVWTKELRQIQQAILENITQCKDLFHYLQEYFMLKIDIRENITQQVSMYSKNTQFKLYIDPTLISESGIQFVEKSVPFAYQRNSNIHFIEFIQLAQYLDFLEKKYYHIEKYSDKQPAEKKLHETQEKFKKATRLYSIPFIGFGALVIVLALSQLGFLLQSFIGLSYGVLGLYTVVMGYLYYNFRQKQREISEEFTIPHYQRPVQLDNASVEIISHELTDDLMLQFGYECFGKTSSHKILNKIEQKHAEQYVFEEAEQDYNELFEGEKEESSDINPEYITRFGDFLD
ncbi:MAG: helix-hairpin-helix domain-containing protein [Candidatus Odinarchaeota archaeon]